MKEKKFYKYELNMTLLNILCFVLFFIPFFIILLCGYNFKIDFSNPLIILELFGYMLVHEIFHGIGYSIFAKDKKNIKYGIALEKGVFYAMCQEEISKTGIIVSLLFPTIFLTLIPLPIALVFHLNILLALSLVNFAGAVGDLAMTLLLLKMPKDVTYIDYNNDVGAYLLSTNDLSNIKSLGMRLTEVGNVADKKVDKSFKIFNITKTSIIIIIVLLIIVLLPTISGLIFKK